jgi:hypothetical protein
MLSEDLFILVVAFLSYLLGKISGRLSVHSRWGRYWDPAAEETQEPEPEDDIGWQHNECGAEVDHDAEFCHVCGEMIETWTDESGAEQEGLPMWKLGEN